MNRREGWVKLIALGFALCAPTFLHARTNNHPEAPKQVQESSKQYNKQLKKNQKQYNKMQKKQAKQNKKIKTTRTVT